MSSILLTAPMAEPLTLDDARAFLRVEHTDDDTLITALITGARMHLESDTRRAFITQTWRMTLDAWPVSGRIDVQPAPLLTVLAARVLDVDGNAQALDLQSFVPILSGTALAFVPWAVSAPGRIAGGIEFDVRVGYGDTAVLMPEPIKQAMRLLIAHWYEHRGVTEHSRMASPSSVTKLIAPYRLVSL